VEASEFRDEYAKFKKAGAEVVSASPDPPRALKKFQEQFKLPFTLLSDADKQLAQAYGVLKEKTMYGKKVMSMACLTRSSPTKPTRSPRPTASGGRNPCTARSSWASSAARSSSARMEN